MATYFVLGADQKEYGPVPVDEIRRWVAEGRADAQSKVRIEGATDWQPLGQIPELAEAPAGRTPAPPPLSRAPAPVSRTSGLAMTALVLGILGLFTCGGTALLGFVVGIIAMVRVTRSGGALTGKGLALAAVIVSGILLLLMPALLVPAIAAAIAKAQQIGCVNNEKQLAQAILQYSRQHDGHLPPAATWCDAIQPQVGSETTFRCPAVPLLRCGYAYNARLDGADGQRVNPKTVMLFDSDAGWNAHGGAELGAARHRGRLLVAAFADGHVETVSEDQVGSLRWEP